MKHISLILIDPQIGFCSPSGSLALNYGFAELGEIQKVIPKLKAAINESLRRHAVVSEYSIGQFTDGDKGHTLANLCVPNKNNDCHIIKDLTSVNFHSSTTKHQQSALSSIKLCSEIERDFINGVRHFVLAGFLLDHCVRSTAEELADKLAGTDAVVTVCSDLSASRLEKHSSGVVDSTVQALKNIGVGYKPWSKILP